MNERFWWLGAFFVERGWRRLFWLRHYQTYPLRFDGRGDTKENPLTAKDGERLFTMLRRIGPTPENPKAHAP